MGKGWYYFFGALFGFGLNGLLTTWAWQADLINRGMAQYCPDTGEWAFKGECEG